MPTQADFEKVNNCIIKPMVEYYECKINDPQRDAFVEDLCGYSTEILNRAWKHVRRESKFPPKLAHFMEVCKETKTIPTEGYRGFERKEDDSHKHDRRNADAVMRSPIGQKAIAEGAAYDFWLYAYRDGKSDFTDADIAKSKRSRAEGIGRLTQYPDKSTQQYAKLEAMFNKMEEKEAELVQKYGMAA